MRIRFDNGLIFGQSPYQLSSIAGLETPAIRNGEGVYSGADGGFMISQYYGARTIVLKGFFFGNCATQTETLRQNLLTKLPLRYNFGLTIEDFNKNYWYISGYVIDIKCEITSSQAGEYQLTILCPDPLLSKATGWLTNTAVTITQDLTINDHTTFLVQGTAQVFPTFVFTAQWANPYGVTIGENSFKMATSMNGTIYADMRERTVKYADNTSQLAYRATDSIWLSLLPGAVTITTFGATTSSSPTAKVIYQPKYRGI